MNTQSNTVSVIIPVKNEGNHVQNTLESLMEAKTDYSYEIIIVDDGSTDGCCNFISSLKSKRPIILFRGENLGVANARNYGADRANGDFLIFCDAHLFFEDFWMDRLLELIEQGKAAAVGPGIADASNPDNVGYGYTWNEELEPKWNIYKNKIFQSPLLAGGCMAITKEAFEDIGGFERNFKIWGVDDEEISLKLWLFGYTCLVRPDVKILHVFRPEAPPFHFSWDDLNFNRLRMVYSHFNESRIKKLKKMIKHSDPDTIETMVKNSNISAQRSSYIARRKYNDDWFMEKFKIPF
ncbi:glycosyl transferase family 2 [Bacillus sp. AFS076308]|uniref:glycosyltransferase family 2 protein n=1 Tax=unclassified Bacillus (in: firmicutes) TaxID=185979 RepID=UPI000BF62D41|nr:MULTISPECIES: glycosyltransferase family 2 protein [unclassified Bacillus (in: firmicutes)]PFO03333.1 glycosyl transferase family 2 [Bacillus sp. AFS076308]PGV50014.1 glycosyl transferase family 2 [Bacillus sp. AFS037270]